MNKVFLLLGGNLGDRKKNFSKAKELLEQYCGNIINTSSLYETAAWGKTDQPFFLNQAVEIETKQSAKEVMNKILDIETMMGRERKEKYGPRIIDIDILLFNEEHYDDPFLQIPHPGMQNRRFVLVPLAEIAGNFQHSVLKKTISQLLKDCPDRLEVRIFTN
ncbi:MAG: 2-amino-4-hydroxy-6-hydroxymethyldihydropteridine diphosphokinase [Chitinophagales bacterium]